MIQGIFEVDVCQKGIICIRKIKKGLVVKQQEKKKKWKKCSEGKTGTNKRS